MEIKRGDLLHNKKTHRNHRVLDADSEGFLTEILPRRGEEKTMKDLYKIPHEEIKDYSKL